MIIKKVPNIGGRGYSGLFALLTFYCFCNKLSYDLINNVNKKKKGDKKMSMTTVNEAVQMIISALDDMGVDYDKETLSGGSPALMGIVLSDIAEMIPSSKDFEKLKNLSMLLSKFLLKKSNEILKEKFYITDDCEISQSLNS